MSVGLLSVPFLIRTSAVWPSGLLEAVLLSQIAPSLPPWGDQTSSHLMPHISRPKRKVEWEKIQLQI